MYNKNNLQNVDIKLLHFLKLYVRHLFMNMSSSSICFLSPHLRLTIILSTYILKSLKNQPLLMNFTTMVQLNL